MSELERTIGEILARLNALDPTDERVLAMVDTLDEIDRILGIED